MDCPLHIGARQHAFQSSLLSHQLINKDPSLSHGVIGRSFTVSHPSSPIHTPFSSHSCHMPLIGDIDFIWMWIVHKCQELYPQIVLKLKNYKFAKNFVTWVEDLIWMILTRLTEFHKKRLLCSISAQKRFYSFLLCFFTLGESELNGSCRILLSGDQIKNK